MPAIPAKYLAVTSSFLAVLAVASAICAVFTSYRFSDELIPRLRALSAVQTELEQGRSAIALGAQDVRQASVRVAQHIGSAVWFARELAGVESQVRSKQKVISGSTRTLESELVNSLTKIQIAAFNPLLQGSGDNDSISLVMEFERAFSLSQRLNEDLQLSFQAQVDRTASWLFACLILVVGSLGVAAYSISVNTQRTKRQHDELESARQKLKDKDEQVQMLVHHDDLTHLPNRNKYSEELEEALDKAARHDRTLALLMLDLDGLKQINETQGLQRGDELLQTYASRIQGTLTPGDRVARVGGSGFAVLLAPDSNPDRAVVAAKAVASKLVNVVQRQIGHEDNEVHISARVGVALFPQDGEDVDSLFGNANDAMVHAKALGRDHVQFYSRRMAAQAKRAFFLETGMRYALSNAEFEVHYQPQYSLTEERYVAFEALVRWPDPTEGFIPPSEFIPVAERTGLIDEIGAFVLRQVCKDFRLWRDADLAPERVCVNLSPIQLETPELIESMVALVDKFELSPECLEFEVTESVLTPGSEDNLARLQALKAAGFRIAIDNFGSGYSSLVSLQKVPIDVLKVDSSFTHDINKDEAANKLLDVMLDMASKLKFTAVAEGVETVKQQSFLAKHNCEIAQGSLYSRPLPAAETEALLREAAGENRPVAVLRRVRT